MKAIIPLIVCLMFSFCTKNKEGSETKLIAGVILPASLQPLEAKEEWLPNGDGISIQRYSIDENVYDSILNQLKKRGSRRMPFAQDVFIDNTIYDYVDEGDDGVYILQSDSEDALDILLIVLDKSKHELIIMISKQ